MRTERISLHFFFIQFVCDSHFAYVIVNRTLGSRNLNPCMYLRFKMGNLSLMLNYYFTSWASYEKLLVCKAASRNIDTLRLNVFDSFSSCSVVHCHRFIEMNDLPWHGDRIEKKRILKLYVFRVSSEDIFFIRLFEKSSIFPCEYSSANLYSRLTGIVLRLTASELSFGTCQGTNSDLLKHAGV